MIKVAMQSVVSCADDPRAVLGGLERALSGQLRDQFVSAAYLWLDTENRTALYSAAGHPPLLRWREGKLERIQSGGLLFGVKRECDAYPVRTMPIQPGDRFLLYTDGVTEPENAHGDSFGDIRLEQVVRDNQWRPPSELSTRTKLGCRFSGGPLWEAMEECPVTRPERSTVQRNVGKRWATGRCLFA